MAERRAIKLEAADQHVFQLISRQIKKVPLSLISLAILLLITIFLLSPPPRKIRFFPTELVSTKSPTNDNVTIAKTLDKSISNSPSSLDRNVNKDGQENCDLFTGEWIPNPEIREYQNCMKYGRPDEDYLKWRWKPDDCELPTFDPHQFLNLVRGKSIAFVGDSLARNHMHSLFCLLSAVVLPKDVSEDKGSQNLGWVYKDYDFRISMFWTPYLIRSERPDPTNTSWPINLYLDEFDQHWTAKIEGFHYIILSAGHWFSHPMTFFEDGRIIGCHLCKEDINVTGSTAYIGYEKALRTSLRAISSLANSEALVFLRTISPSHFEGGSWNDGGDCVRTRPFRKNETFLEPHFREMRKIQLQEFRVAEEERRRRGLKLRLLDVTQPMLLRPDGHPRKYGYGKNEHVTNDCLHWCMPGPVDTWNDMLFELIKREEKRQN